MRITQLEKAQLIHLIEKQSLSKELFEYMGDEETFSIKYINNYFEFIITRVAHSKFNLKYKPVSNKSYILIDNNTWSDTKVRFEEWVAGVASDIKYQIKPTVKKPILSDRIKSVEKYSKQFVNIYNQAQVAESIDLHEICGLGYRKAFEFLIKDYLIKRSSKENHSDIKEKPIYNCIDKYITDIRIKLLSKRVLELGNDHAHYLKKWKGQTLLDLKKLIELTIEWIILTDEFERIQNTTLKRRKRSVTSKA